MIVYEVSCSVIAAGQEFRNLGRWSWMMMQGKNNVRTRITTAYCPTVTVSSGGAYNQQLEAFAIMKIQTDPRTQFWIDLKKDISKWIHQGEKIIPIGDWDIETSEVNTCMEKQGPTNAIRNIHGYSDTPIICQ